MRLAALGWAVCEQPAGWGKRGIGDSGVVCPSRVLARRADPSTYVAFAVLWALYYAVAGSVAGLQLEVTRWVVVRDANRTEPTVSDADGGGWGLLWVAVLVGSISAIVVLASFPLWREFLSAGWSVAILLALGALTLTGLILILGVLVAQRRWRAAAILLGADALVRLVATALAVAFSSELSGYALAIVSGSLVWAPMLLTSRDGFLQWSGRGVPLECAGPSDDSHRIDDWRFAVDRGPPVVVRPDLHRRWRRPECRPRCGNRPVPLPSPRIGPGCSTGRTSRTCQFRCRCRPACPPRDRAHAIAAVVLTTGAYALGPALLRVSFGDSYVVSHTQAAGLALSAVVLAYAVHLSVALVALDQHRRGTKGRLIAVLATLLALVLPVNDDARLLLAAVGGPLLGVAYLSIAWVGVVNRMGSES